MKKHWLNINEIMPSQLYISSEKLANLLNYIAETDIDQIDPLPIKRISNTIFYTDGHTRAYALAQRGIDKIPVYWEEDELDWEAYLNNVKWCRDNQINSVLDLKSRVISKDQYQVLWDQRCDLLHQQLRGNPLFSLEIKQVESAEEKGRVCHTVLRSLPNWFCIEEAIVDYVKECRKYPCWVMYIADTAIGIISLLEHNEHTSEIYVMGIVPEFHRHGIGARAITQVKDQLRKENKKFLTVKTLSSAHPDPYYRKTREFYLRLGFHPIEEFPTLWGKENPCLMLAMTLSE